MMIPTPENILARALVKLVYNGTIRYLKNSTRIPMDEALSFCSSLDDGDASRFSPWEFVFSDLCRQNSAGKTEITYGEFAELVKSYGLDLDEAIRTYQEEN